MFDSLLEALEHDRKVWREEGRKEGREEAREKGRIDERLETARNLFGEDMAALMGRLLSHLPLAHWPTQHDMYTWSGSRAEFAEALRQRHQELDPGALPGADNGRAGPNPR